MGVEQWLREHSAETTREKFSVRTSKATKEALVAHAARLEIPHTRLAQLLIEWGLHELEATQQAA